MSYGLFVALMAGGMFAVIASRSVLNFGLWMLDKWSPEESK